MNEVFILGAGFSKAISNTMPLTKDLSAEVLERYSEGDSMPTDIRDMIQEDFEKGLTFLAQEKPWLREAQNLRQRALFLDLTSVIKGILHEKCRDPGVWGTNTPPQWLDRLILHWHVNRCSVITLNYDTLIERVAVVKGRPVHTGRLYPIPLTLAGRRAALFGGSGDLETFKLFKLHGSINWFYSGRSNSYGEEIYYVPCSGGLEGLFAAARGQDPESVHWTNVRDKTALIIPPVLDKNIFFQHEALRSLWALASQAIKKARRIVCMGYSLPSSDITMAQFLRSSSPDGRTPFAIVDLCSMIDHFAGVIGTTSYELTQDQTGQNCVEQFVTQNYGLK